MNPSSTTGWTWIPIPVWHPDRRRSGQGFRRWTRPWTGPPWKLLVFSIFSSHRYHRYLCWNCVVPWLQVERKRCVKFNEKTGRGWVCKETPVSCWILWSLWKHSRVATPWDNQPCNMQELWATSIEIGQRLHLEIGNDAGRPLLDRFRFLSLCNYSKRNLYGGCI